MVPVIAGAKEAAPRAIIEAARASAQADDGPELTFMELTGEAREAAIDRIETYLNGITTIVAGFTQASTDGSVGDGKFFMKRPGKMRWQYNPPTPILLVSDGKVVTYYDAGLDQVTYIGIDDTLAGFLTSKILTLNSASTQLTKLEAAEGVIRATVVRTKKPSEGSLTLEFTEKPFEIRYMTAIDATGNQTRVQLQNAQFGPRLEDKLFTFEDPRSVNHRRNKN
jgi:chaperone LolA